MTRMPRATGRPKTKRLVINGQQKRWWYFMVKVWFLRRSGGAFLRIR